MQSIRQQLEVAFTNFETKWGKLNGGSAGDLLRAQYDACVNFFADINTDAAFEFEKVNHQDRLAGDTADRLRINVINLQIALKSLKSFLNQLSTSNDLENVGANDTVASGMLLALCSIEEALSPLLGFIANYNSTMSRQHSTESATAGGGRHRWSAGTFGSRASIASGSGNGHAALLENSQPSAMRKFFCCC